MHNSPGEMSHRFGMITTETFLAQRQRSVQEIKKAPCKLENIPARLLHQTSEWGKLTWIAPHRIFIYTSPMGDLSVAEQ